MVSMDRFNSNEDTVLDDDKFNEGVLAHKSGKSLKDNPYKSQTPYAVAWAAGWADQICRCYQSSIINKRKGNEKFCTGPST